MDTASRSRLRNFLIEHQSLIILFIGFVSLALTIRQNRLLQGQVTSCALRQKTLAGDLELSRKMMQLVGEPMPLTPQLKALVHDPSAAGGDLVVVVFNPTTCGRSLRDQLSIVRSFQEHRAQDSQAFLGLIGADTREDQSYALMLRSNKLMTFPFSYARSRDLSSLFPLESDTDYIDTPIYLLVDRDFRIRSVFKPDSSKPETLERWLERRLAT